MTELQIIELPVRADQRGRSIAVPDQAFEFLSGVAETHMAELLSGAVRGNHWHDNRNEVMVVRADNKWQLAWAADKDSPVQTKCFEAGQFVAILIPRLTCHAIKNVGAKPIWVSAIADGKYDGVTPDTYPIELLT